MARKKTSRPLNNQRPKATHGLKQADAKAFESAFSRGDYSRALEVARTLVQRSPDSPQAHEWHANALGRLERLDEAVDAMQQAVSLVGSASADQRLKLAQYQILAGKAAQAVETLEGVVQEEPENVMALAWLSRAYHQLGQNSRGLEVNDHLMSRDDRHEEGLLWRSRILDQLSRHDETMEALETLQKVNPRRVGVHNHIASLFTKEGDYDKAEQHYQKELALDPSNGKVHSNLWMSSHYNPAYDGDDLFRIAVDWDRRFGEHSSRGRASTTRDAGKRLRIGLLSGGFRMHPVGQMILPALQSLPTDQFDLLFYSSNQYVDKLTQSIQMLANRWQSIEGLSDAQLDQKIRDDEIDILIDLNGAGDGSRYRTLTREPAPLIVKWVGSLVNTTGLESIDYLLSDHVETPEGVDDCYTEKLIRLPDDYICYHFPRHVPVCNGLPALTNGYITFGCLNNPAKLSAPLLREWAKLLTEIPDSKLLLRGIQFESERFRNKITATFAEHGVSEDRLVMEGPAKHEEFLKTYQRIDIALDTWPYSGGLTTCESLLMGVPVVTRTGPTFAGRHSATHLVNAGLPELVTDSWEDFRERIKELADDLPNLAVIRAALRTILLDSPICDGPRFANHLTTALRAIWQRHCEGKAPEALSFAKSGAARFADEDAPVKLTLASPVQGFDWQLESPILAVDNGAVLASRLDVRELLGSGRVIMLSFDPAGKMETVDHLAQYGEIQHFPYTALGDGQPTTLHTGEGLEPASLEPIDHDGEIVRHEIPTVALDGIEGLPNIDLLALDNVHDVAAILDNGIQALKNSLLLQVGVAFQPTHQRQTNLAEVQHWASRNGFRFYRLDELHHRSQLPEDVKVIQHKATELVSAYALFLPSDERIAALDNGQRMKLVYLLSTFFEAHDVAYKIMSGINRDGAMALLESQGVVKRSLQHKSDAIVPYPAGPIIPQSEHVSGEVVVSVICISYNHRDYIEDAIKGFVAQKTNFPFEVIVHDDASTDGTQEIVREYADKYPGLIRPVYQEKNQYSQGYKPIANCLSLAKGRYIALCEGDDYWVDNGKLQVQFDYMEQHPECVLTHHNAFVFNGNGVVKESKLAQGHMRGFGEDELQKNNCFILTLSMMFRKVFDRFPKEIGDVVNEDNLLISMLGLYGESAYLPQIKPSAYRLHEASVWSSKSDLEKTSLLSDSFYRISKYHEREGREKLANVYLKKSDSLGRTLQDGVRKKKGFDGKIFCIGSNKTGTTSIKRAFEDLGFSVGDQRVAEALTDKFYFSGMFDGVVDYCKSSTVFQDVPFSLPETYKHLDKAYPGSKFILTVRDNADQWYRSITRFHAKMFGIDGEVPTAYDLRCSKYVSPGFAYKFVKLFGGEDFDIYNRESMISHYEAHIENVLEYFASRPGDLLVVNLSEEGGYERFCDFIGVESPFDSFPWVNRT